MSMKAVRRWGAIGSGLVLSVAMMSACGGDDDTASDTGGQEAQTQTSDASMGESQNVIHHLQALDQTYSSGDAAAAQEHLDEATSAWGSLSSTFPAEQARQIQGQLDTLGSQLASSAPASDVTSTVQDISTALAAAPAAPAG
jgi:hypothetical protein